MKFLLVFLFVCATALGNIVPKLDGRIVGGEEVSIEQFPYQVSVRIYDQHICGGSLINPIAVLTAAHCVYGMDYSQYTIRVGNSTHNQGYSIPVSKVNIHFRYNPDTMDHDLAILSFREFLEFNSTVQKIALQEMYVEVPAGTTAWVSGWGVTSEGSQTIPERLRAVDVAVISNVDCANKYGNESITPRMLCTQTLNHDSCQGDSGGPLVANGKLIGVVSWGYGCARPQYPGVYANVSEEHFWIIINQI